MVKAWSDSRMDIQDTRRARLRDVIGDESVSSFALRVKKSPTQIADMLAGRKSFGEKVARNIEVRAQLTPLSLDGSSAIPPSSDVFDLDPELIADLAHALQDAFDEHLGRPYNLADEPELFAGAYKLAAGGTTHDLRRALLWLGGQIRERMQAAGRDVPGEKAVDASTGAGRRGAA